VKDRAAKSLVQGLIDSGKLAAGGTIVEGTAGNTGIGLTFVANSLGYKTVIVIPRTQTQEKKNALRQAGATLVEVDAKPYADPNNYIKISGRIADEIPGAVWANQFDVSGWLVVQYIFLSPPRCFVRSTERGQSQGTL
jgi:cysteine synthase